MNSLKVACAAALAAFPIAAQAAVIDFNGLQPDGNNLYGYFDSYSQDGYTATEVANTFSGSFYTGYINESNPSPQINGSGTLSVTGPGLFSFTSFDSFVNGNLSTYTVTGYLAGLSIFAQSGTITAPPSGAIVTNPYTTYGGFSALLVDQVTIELSAGAYLDNIRLAPAATADVPEPATWAMLVGGFGMIGGAMRRRKTVVAYA